MKNIKFNILKKGAVFGIDARISLVIIAIVSLAIAVNKQSLNESQRLKDSTFNILKLEDHILEQYAIYHDNISILETIYSESTSEQDKFWSKNSYLKTDPWDNNWNFIVRSSISDNIKAFGEPIVPKCIIIFSAGADGRSSIFDNYTGTTYADCLNNVRLPTADNQTELTDDLFYKFTTINYDIEANEEVKQRLNKIKESLNNYKKAQKNIRVKYCNGLTAVVANADVKCDIDLNGTYDESELDAVNYLPKSSLDLTALAKYSESTSYDYKILADRENMLSRVGLPKSYNEDPLGRALYYHSNINGAVTSPFVAEFKYLECATCAFE